MDPTKFRLGDIVEAQLSFAAVPIKDGKQKLLMVLRALTLLDSTPTKASCCELMFGYHVNQWLNNCKNAHMNRLKDIQRQEVVKPKTLKRRVCYSEEDEVVREMRKQMMALQIGQLTEVMNMW